MEILKELHDDFMIYAKEVNESRAFPDVRDGLKPSTRAVLWEMYDKKYFSSKPHVKSAKVTGGVIGNWHPHGDSSAYEALVRMSQPWLNNIPEVDWHGANGSLVGGPEAASARYTECRLSKASEQGFFKHINTVDYQLNFSEDLEWPVVFPAIFPRLFVNGGSGIGYTIANSWPLGNIKEFEKKLKDYIKGKFNYRNIYPDFPSGGIIINKSAMEEIYKTGKGTIILRGKAEIKDNLILITELPYQVYGEQFIQEVKDLVNEGKLDVEDIFNKSGKDGLLIEVECLSNPKLVLNQLYKLTDLQINYPVNQMALYKGQVKLLSLETYIKSYYEFNIKCIKKEFELSLEKAQSQLEIVEGLIKAISMLDKIIETIKSSTSLEKAKDSIIKLGFSKNQANAIVDLKLGRLAKLEFTKLETEQRDLLNQIDECKEIIASKEKQDDLLLNRLSEFVKNFGYDRRTEVVDVNIKEEKVVKEKIDHDFFIVLTNDNRLKRIKAEDFRKTSEQTVKLKESQKLILLSSSGMMYKKECKKIPLCSNKASGTELEEKIIAICSEEADDILFITSKGLVKRLDRSNLKINKNSGAQFIKLDNDYVERVEFVNDDSEVFISGKQIVIPKSKGRGAGGTKWQAKKIK